MFSYQQCCTVDAPFTKTDFCKHIRFCLTDTKTKVPLLLSNKPGKAKDEKAASKKKKKKKRKSVYYHSSSSSSSSSDDDSDTDEVVHFEAATEHLQTLEAKTTHGAFTDKFDQAGVVLEKVLNRRNSNKIATVRIATVNRTMQLGNTRLPNFISNIRSSESIRLAMLLGALATVIVLSHCSRLLNKFASVLAFRCDTTGAVKNELPSKTKRDSIWPGIAITGTLACWRFL